MRSVIVYSVILMLRVSALAGIQWPQRNVELRPKPDEPQVVATFPFTNAGSEPVTITSLRTSCHCTTAPLAKQTPTPE